jgi:hypothetical protein
MFDLILCTVSRAAPSEAFLDAVAFAEDAVKVGNVNREFEVVYLNGNPLYDESLLCVTRV